MYKILTKKLIAPQIYSMDVLAPRVAKAAKPGQFVIIRMDEKGERIPLTICDYDEEKGSVNIVFQTIGSSTNKMADYNVGDSFLDFVGPLGQPSELVHESMEELKNEKLLFIAGGVGTAPVYPQLKWLHERGISADVIVGAKSQNYLILQDELKKVAGNVFIATDDGSFGFKGLVTQLLEKLVKEDGKEYTKVIAIGPMIMMKFVCKVTKQLNIKTIVSLNTLMVDGTGMCGACRVTVGGKTKFTCVDGPEFDGHLIDFEEAMRRQGMYKAEEAKSQEKHKCECGLH